MIPDCPVFDIGRPNAACAVTRRVHSCEPIVQRHVNDDRHQNRANEIEQAPGEKVDRVRFVPSKKRRNGKHEATECSPEERCEKPSVEHIDINGLHRRDPLSGGEARERSHDEGRKHEEDSGDDR